MPPVYGLHACGSSDVGMIVKVVEASSLLAIAVKARHRRAALRGEPLALRVPPVYGLHACGSSDVGILVVFVATL